MMSIPSETHEMKEMEQKPQTLCPVMGGKINKEFYADYNGMRIYFCCPGCDKTFREYPEKYLQEMRMNHVEPEPIEPQRHEH